MADMIQQGEVTGLAVFCAKCWRGGWRSSASLRQPCRPRAGSSGAAQLAQLSAGHFPWDDGESLRSVAGIRQPSAELMLCLAHPNLPPSQPIAGEL